MRPVEMASSSSSLGAEGGADDQRQQTSGSDRPAGAPPVARVLVADDEAPVRDFISRALEHTGYEVRTVEDGLTAWAALVDDPPYDLLITDIVMPGLDGIELALKASKEHPDMAILMITGFAAEKQRAYGLENLIHKVLSKPFTLSQLLTATKEALNG
jgi:DNA-binding response OmpR family regulator